MIELKLAAVLTSAPPITALVGTRTYPVTLPTDPTLPALDYKIVGASTSPTFETSGLTKYRVEVNSWGNTYSDAVTLRDAVIGVLNGYQDANLTINLIQPTDFFDSDLLQYRAMAEFYCWSPL